MILVTAKALEFKEELSKKISIFPQEYKMDKRLK
jgi:penicillin V acylase-like amidase (Ntn superfamily)